ncbi:MAG: response regulator transcription factor [Schleiferiaceae bacterium]|nr:response regulator transcription factor [Schleiferiaceae bacterium]
MNARDYKLLIVDDEVDILEIISYNLKKEGFVVETASHGEEAIKKLETYLPHLILLDVMMPGMDGMETCDLIRKDPRFDKTIVAFLTARGEDYSQLAGFEAGADDYITKPIKPKLLVGRLKALLRRVSNDISQNEIAVPTTVEVGNVLVDYEQYQVTVAKKKIDLPRKEFELLSLLISKPGKVFPREEIMDRIWGSEVVVGGRTIDVHIRKLREKIGDEKIRTIKGVGYKYKG